MCILAFLIGIVVTAANAFLCLRVSVCSTAKMIIASRANKESAVGFPFYAGCIVATGGISLMILVFVIFLYSIRSKK
jgi:hypothetical protein